MANSMSCLRMEDAFSISSSSAKDSKSAGFLFLRSCNFIACRPSCTVMGEAPDGERGEWFRCTGGGKPRTHHRRGWFDPDRLSGSQPPEPSVAAKVFQTKGL